MGCPVPKVAGNGEGSALMKRPDLVDAIVRKTVSRIRKPVTVKIRSGFTADTVNAVEIAKIAEAAGASAVAVHGRTREQYYTGKADWDIIRQVKEAVKIPVIGNGDVDSPESAKRMLDETGCDGVMGRAGRARQSMAVPGDRGISGRKTGARAPFQRRDSGNNAAPYKAAAGVQGRIYRHAGDAEAHCVVYRRFPKFRKAARCDQRRGNVP